MFFIFFLSLIFEFSYETHLMFYFYIKPLERKIPFLELEFECLSVLDYCLFIFFYAIFRYWFLHIFFAKIVAGSLSKLIFLQIISLRLIIF